MQTLAAATAKSASTGVFETTKDGKVWVHITSTFDSGTITMEKSIDLGANWGTFYPDGTAETYTFETTKLYDLPGGWQWRFTNDASASATAAYVDGNAIRLV